MFTEQDHSSACKVVLCVNNYININKNQATWHVPFYGSIYIDIVILPYSQQYQNKNEPLPRPVSLHVL